MEKMKNKINKLLKKDLSKTILKYSGGFLIVSIFLIILFYKFNKSFIWSYDGLHQHIITLQYFRNLIINLIRNGSISTFTWNIGLGLDMFSNLTYYIFGDFLSFFSILFPAKSIELLYNILVIARIYLVGITFLCYCKYKKMDSFASVIGALIYAFCGFILYSGTRHPYFTNSVMLLPLVFIGIEKIILEDKATYYTIMIAILYITNFYFAYSTSIIIAIYGIILIIYKYKKDGYKKIINKTLKVFLYSVIGIMISGIILVPTGIGFISSERTSVNVIYPYVLNYYRNMMNSLLMPKSSGYWMIWGTQSLIFISLPVFFRRRKENKPLFLTLMALLSALLISNIGSIFCGFNYPNNRWAFGITFIFAFITTSFLSRNEINSADLKSIGIFSAIYFAFNVLFEININTYIEFQLLLIIILLLLYYGQSYLKKISKKINIFKCTFYFVILIGIISSIKYLYLDYDYISQFLNHGTLLNTHASSDNTISDFDKAIKYIKEKDKDFYRISKYPYKHENISLIKNYNSIGQYYSITPGIYGELNSDLSNAQYYINIGSKEFDYRTKITTLLGNRYYITSKNNNTVPYGYTNVIEYNGTSKIYKNKNALPFAVFYKNYIKEEDFISLKPLEKENLMLKAVALPSNQNIKNMNNVNKIRFDNIKAIDYKINDTNKIIKENNNIIINSTAKNKFQLNIKNIKNSEIYVVLENLKFNSFTKEEMISFGINEKSTEKQKYDIKNKYKWYYPTYDYNIQIKFRNTTKNRTIYNYEASPYYMDVNDFMFNLGYYNQTSGDITITLSKIGHYTFDDIKAYAVSMDDYEQDINNLRRSNFKLKDYGNGYLNGTVDCEENGVLQFSTLYTKGWKVYVDGKLTENFKTNKYFLGINIEKGKHTISLKYHNPYLKYGAILSAIGIISLVILTKNNKNKQK